MAEQSNKSAILQFTPFISSVNPSFWFKLTQNKLDYDRLNDDAKPIWGYYTNYNNVDNFLDVDCTSFNKCLTPEGNIFPSYGTIFNKNTIEEFKSLDKTELLNTAGEKLWLQIATGECIDNPSLLANFIILSFADLKKYQFYYWFAFPVPIIPNQTIAYLENDPQSLSEVFNTDQVQELYKEYSSWTYKKQQFFIMDASSDTLRFYSLKDLIEANNEDNLKKYENNINKLYFCFADSNERNSPGWQLRNFITLLVHHCPILRLSNINGLSVRLRGNTDGIKNSLVFKIKMTELQQGSGEGTVVQTKKFVGWERNERGNFGPKLANMASQMDPAKLAETSVDLNLKLMKWRLLPNIDLDKIRNIKCLLLGAGTLGCGVARNLMAWGVRNISLVDSGKVSYSNPVRQSLFTHEDCLNGGKPKAATAAKRLKEIFPGMNAEGYNLRIPMPGHPVGASLKDEVTKDLERINSLIKGHDCIFLLMDSRESRWLPTMIGASMKKIVINAALGFDSYMVMRHGVLTDSETPPSASAVQGLRSISGDNLGCYFCNDVISPGNSLRDRTLDQQCTVTRPGVSNMAASIATELLVSMLQHKDGPLASAYYSTESGKGSESLPMESLLGVLPHSVRGYISSYEQVTPATERFKQCVACSKMVLEEYEKEGSGFLFKVFESDKYLEDLTGLTHLLQEAENINIMELSESDGEME